MSEEDYKIAYENVMIANKMLEQENKQLKEKINKALHKLKSSVNHFKTQRENNAVTFTIKILGDKENERD